MPNPRAYRAVAEFYDAEHVHEPMLQRDVPFLLRHFPRRPCDALEIAVGTARAAIPVAQAGHRVVGIDHDPAMLSIARRKRDFVGMDDRSLRLVRMDATRLALGRRFDRVFILFNTLLAFTTLARLDRVLRGARTHLKPGGRFWLDIFNPDPLILAHRQRTLLSTLLFHDAGRDRTVQRRTFVRVDYTRQVQTVEYEYAWFDRDGRPRRRQRTFELTFLLPRELQLLLERNGLRVEEQWGDHDGSALTDRSPRIIASCRRASAREAAA